MNNFTVKGITAFIPAQDYNVSRQFYNNLGFTEVDNNDKATYFMHSNVGFWLQDYYVEDFANNFMLCIYVEDLDTWWQRIQKMNFDRHYKQNAKVHAAPHDQKGGYMLQISDPSGVLWHFRQNP